MDAEEAVLSVVVVVHVVGPPKTEGIPYAIPLATKGYLLRWPNWPREVGTEPGSPGETDMQGDNPHAK